MPYKPQTPPERVLAPEAIALLDKLTKEDRMLAGRDRLYQYVRKNHPGVQCSRRDVMHYLRGCTWWQKTVRYPKRAATKSITVKSPRFFAIDLKGPLIRAPGGWQYVIGVIQVATRRCFLLPMQGSTARETAEKLAKIIDENNLDISIINSDNGSEFVGEFAEFCKERGIVQYFNQPHSPWQNRQERVFWDFTNWLTRLEQDTGKKTLWARELPKFQEMMNTTVCRSIKVAPNDAGDIPTQIMEARQKDYGVMKRFKQQKTALQIHDLVRLRIRKKQGLKALKVRWSEEIYTISKVIRGNSKLITYKLEFQGAPVKGSFNITDLLRISSGVPADGIELIADMGPDVEERTVHDQRELDELLRDAEHPVTSIRETRRPGPVDNDDEFEIESILAQRKFGKTVKYLVKWLGYPRTDAMWLPAREIDAPEIMAEWRKEQRAKK